jgi:mono/diheme cytochrome c family protein
MRNLLRSCAALIVFVALWSAVSFASVGAQRANAAADVAAGPGVSLDRGRHLAKVIGCTDCHTANLGGGPLYDDPTHLVLWAPNLTTGAGGLLAHHSAADFARAVRRGIGPDGKRLLVMPSWDYAALTDADLASIYAYVRSVPPVDRHTPPAKFGPKAPAAFASGEIRYDADVLARSTLPRFDATPAVSPAYGSYLARVAGCESCHGVHLDGSLPSSAFHAPNRSQIIPHWTTADFVTAIRTGMTPGGGKLSDDMPWKVYAGMTDDELHAVLAYLRTIPPRAAGS